MNFLQEKITDIHIPTEAPYFEAFGAALYGLENEVNTIENYDDIFIPRSSSFVFHQPLKNLKTKFSSKQWNIIKQKTVMSAYLDLMSAQQLQKQL